MYKWKIIRAWINKNDGKFYQIDNQKLNIYEVTGYLSLIFAFVVYIFHEKTGFQFIWLGWLCFVIGCITLIIGILKKLKSEEST